MKKFTLLIIACVLLSACNLFNRNRIVKSDDSASLEFVTDDSIFYANPRLVRLMDTLYRYVRSDGFPATNVQRDIKWMSDFRRQLCDYYADTRHHCILSAFTMADSVLAEARALYESVDDQSTMGLIVANNVEYTRMAFEQFNEFGKLYNSCTTDEQRDILTREFEAWRDVEQTFDQLYADCVELYYWGGSICGPLRTNGVLEIMDAHVDLYRRELPDGPGSLQGDYSGPVTSARALSELLETCRASIPESDATDPESEEYTDGYYETAQEAEELLALLPDQLETWLNIRHEWEAEMAAANPDTRYPRNTAQLLTNLASSLSALVEE